MKKKYCKINHQMPQRNKLSIFYQKRDKNNEITKLHHFIIEKEKKIQDLESRIKEVNQQLTEKEIQFEKEKNILKHQLEQINSYHESIEKDKSSKKKNATQFYSQTLKYSQLHSSQDKNNDSKFFEVEPPEEQEQFTVFRVTKSDIQEVIKQIKYKLISSSIEYEVIDNIFNNENNGFSIMDLQIILESSPFYLSQEKALQIARYIIEENESDQPYLIDFNLTCNSSRIRSILKILIGTYNLLETQITQLEQLYKKIGRKKEGLNELLIKNNKKTLSKEEFEETCKQLEISITKSEIEICIKICFAYTQDINLIDPQILIEYLEDQAIKNQNYQKDDNEQNCEFEFQ